MYILIGLLRLLVISIVVYFIYKIFTKKKARPSSKRKKQKTQYNNIEEMKKDPICGTYIPESQAKIYENGKEIFFFCSEECQRKFLKK